MASMKTSEAGIRHIKNSEGLRLKAYTDSAGVWTIGYGHTGKDVTPGQSITEAKANQLLAADLAHFEEAVNRLVKVPLTQGQFDALVSFAFNLGEGADGLGGSTLLKKLNDGEYVGAAQEFDRWVHAEVDNQVVVVLPGLVDRRNAEQAMFLSSVPPAKPEPKSAAVPTSAYPRLFMPAEKTDKWWELRTEREEHLAKDFAARMGLRYRHDLATNKVFIGHPKDEPNPAQPAGKWKVVPLRQGNDVSCGQTSVAMAINAITGKKLTDNDINAKYGFGLLAALNGESGKTWIDGGNLDVVSDWDVIKNKLAKGPVVVGLNGPIFSPSGRGHIVLITAINGDKVTFADPAWGEFRTVTEADMMNARPHPDGKFLFWMA